MRVLYLATAAILLGTGFATAGSPLELKGEEAFALDLSAVGGPTLFLKCSRGTSLTDNCGIISIWQQANIIPGLQTSIYSYGATQYERDDNLLA